MSDWRWARHGRPRRWERRLRMNSPASAFRYVSIEEADEVQSRGGRRRQEENRRRRQSRWFEIEDSMAIFRDKFKVCVFDFVLPSGRGWWRERGRTRGRKWWRYSAARGESVEFVSVNQAINQRNGLANQINRGSTPSPTIIAAISIPIFVSIFKSMHQSRNGTAADGCARQNPPPLFPSPLQTKEMKSQNGQRDKVSAPTKSTACPTQHWLRPASLTADTGWPTSEPVDFFFPPLCRSSRSPILPVIQPHGAAPIFARHQTADGPPPLP